MCSCVIPQLTDTFSFRWFNDGREVTPTEADKIKGIEESCVRKFGGRSPKGRAPSPRHYSLGRPRDFAN